MSAGARSWNVIAVLAAAQFVMVLDTTVMNVAISDVVADLDTTVSRVQAAITLFTLVMAALMLTGGKLGDIFGRRRMFAVGLAIYALGSALTAIAPGIELLLIGWSLLEGIGASLVVPAIAALIAGNYSGGRRAVAFGIIGGVAAGGAAAGPLIGGAVTSAASWRWVFVAEVVIIAGILLTIRLIDDLPRGSTRPRLDGGGAALSAAGMGLAVFGLLQAGTWGWVAPRRPPRIGDSEITPLGLSPTLFVVAIGLVVLAGFLRYERHQIAVGNEPIVRPELLRIPQLRGGLSAMVAQQCFALGTLFVIPLYLQVVIGKDAFETGLVLLPITISMLVMALLGARLSATVAPRGIVRAALVAMAAGGLGLVGTIDTELSSAGFAVALAVTGVGLGLLASQIGNINLSSVGPESSSEVGGLQGTAQNLGGSIGTALIGAVLLGGLAGAFANEALQNPGVPASARAAIEERAVEGIDFVRADDVAAAASAAGLAPGEVDAVVSSYENAQIIALKLAVLIAVAVALLALLVTRNLPARPLAAEPAEPRAG